ncbi:hypothetical protein D9757_002675 [Collybiopsis confluens]|uniref:Uncharacterized protein n=1 Tax=Collybiopsis confluens TaxID=2823264 RepID=A0A8H5HWY5_9AGAR|nr:hypothetical protein D9757_002675 [Collybiopsis confluens]
MTMIFGLAVLTFFASIAVYVSASTIQAGASCSTTRDHLDPNTHKFVSDCSDTAYCSGSSNGTCVPRKCRRDIFPFGYSFLDEIPPLCPAGTFCPDEGDGCRAQGTVGDACQMNRDEQCARAANWQDFAGDGNSYGSICLNSACMFANATLGSPCVIDNTTYRFDDTSTLTVVRDNCRSPQYYCGQKDCEQSKAVGSSCSIDQECEQRNCVSGTCSEPPETPLRVTTAQYVITATCIIGAMVSIGSLMTLIHKRHRLKRYRELRDYYQEQLRYVM